jgi:uncharacterized protein YkwD
LKKKLAMAVAAGLLMAGLTATPSHAEMTLTQIRLAMIDKLNDKRASKCGRNLKMHTGLNSAAQYHAVDMAVEHYFSHDSQNPYESFMNRVRRLSKLPPGTIAQENIALIQGGDYRHAVNAWMNSPGHKRIVLDCQMTKVGVGYRFSGPTGNYWVADFAS